MSGKPNIGIMVLAAGASTRMGDAEATTAVSGTELIAPHSQDCNVIKLPTHSGGAGGKG